MTRAVQTRDRDESETAVQTKLVEALKRRREATIADLVTDSALPKNRVEEGMRLILHEYVGHLKATQSGELLYSFPTGMRNQVRGFGPSFRRAMRTARSGAARVLSFLFKIWIAVMLVGYFALFVALFILALVASVAGSMAGRGEGGRDTRSRGGGIGGFFLVSRIIDLLFIRILLNGGARRDRGEKGRPLHLAVFGFVFGEKDQTKEWEERERTTILRYLRARKGVITLEELVRISGRSREEAERLLTSLLIEYEGEPLVTDRGTIIYSFPELLRTRAEALKAERGAAAALPECPLVPFSDNKPKTNRWIAFFNAFNLVFGGYFLAFTGSYLAGALSAAGFGAFYVFVGRLIEQLLQVSPVPVLGIGLGLVPAAFSVIFFAVTLIRRAALERKNEEIRKLNTRRDVYGAVMARPEAADPAVIVSERAEREKLEAQLESTGRRLERPLLDVAVERPPRKRERQNPRDLPGFVAKEIDELASAKRAEIEKLESGALRYRFAELAEEIQDVEKYRSGVDVKQYDVGKTVFDSAE